MKYKELYTESKFDYEYDSYYNPQNVRTPSEHFKMPIIGIIKVKDIINKGNILTYEVIYQQPKFFVVNTWNNYQKKNAQLVPKDFVKNFMKYKNVVKEEASPALQKRLKGLRRKTKCMKCGFEIPIYKGRYPKECPKCKGVELSDALEKSIKATRRKLRCQICGMEIPVYPGKYPEKCPECGSKQLI